MSSAFASPVVFGKANENGVHGSCLSRSSHHPSQIKRLKPSMRVAGPEQNACPRPPKGHNLGPKPGAPPPPRHFRVPILGSLFDVLFAGPECFGNISNRIGPVFKTDLVGRTAVVVCSHELSKQVLGCPELFLTGQTTQSIVRLLGDKSLISTDGAEHTVQRKAMTPAFAPALFPHYCARLGGHVRSSFSELAVQYEDVTRTGKEVLLDTFFRELVFTATLDMTAGIDQGKRPEDLAEVFSNFCAMCDGLLAPMLPFGPYPKAVKATDSLMEFISRVIEERLESSSEVITKIREMSPDTMASDIRAELQSGDVDIVTLLVAQTNLPVGRSEQSVSSNPGQDASQAGAVQDQIEACASQIRLRWFAGYETVASTMSSGVHVLNDRPDILRRLRHEQDQVFERTSGDISVSNVMSDMPVLDAFVCEVLRRHTASGSLLRTVAPGGATLGGFSLEPGMLLMLDNHFANKDPAVFPNPSEFNLDRFASPEEKKAARTNLMAHGSGPHKCIASAFSMVVMKTVLAELVREYDVVLSSSHSGKFTSLPIVTPASRLPLESFLRRTQ